MKFWILISGSFVANILWFGCIFSSFCGPEKHEPKVMKNFHAFNSVELSLLLIFSWNLTFSNLWANRDFMFNFGITEIWKHPVQVQETCTTCVCVFHPYYKLWTRSRCDSDLCCDVSLQFCQQFSTNPSLLLLQLGIIQLRNHDLTKRKKHFKKKKTCLKWIQSETDAEVVALAITQPDFWEWEWRFVGDGNAKLVHAQWEST